MDDKENWLAFNWFHARKAACEIGGIENLSKLADAEAALAQYASTLWYGTKGR